MPRPRRKAAAPEREPDVEMDETEVAQDGPGQPLKFDEPLTWKAGKPLAVSELLRRLRKLHQELDEMDQEEADRDSLVPRAQELANTLLTAHRDKGVRAWTLLNITDMFRLLAPDAPYKGTQLKQIFSLFVNHTVLDMANPADPYFQQARAALQSLTYFKSIVLLTDLPGSDLLIQQLFTNTFDVLAGNVKGGEGEPLPMNVENHMTEMLCTLVVELRQLPPNVVDTVLAQFLRVDPSTLGYNALTDDANNAAIGDISPAYNVARSVCNTCAEPMARAVSQYFSSVLIDASESFSVTKTGTKTGRKRARGDDEEDVDDGLPAPPNEKDLQEVEKAHRLLRELWRSAPDVISAVVPQIETEAGAENAHIRTLAVQTIGDMVAGIGAMGPAPPTTFDPSAFPSRSMDDSVAATARNNLLFESIAPHAFSSIYPQAYQAFMDRHRDKTAQVRAAWVTAAGHIIATSGGGKGLSRDQESQLLRHMAEMLLDQDEKVRLAAIQAIARFDFNTIVRKLGPHGSVDRADSVLHNLADRIKDPKRAPRTAALELLGRIWGVAAGGITEGKAPLKELFGSIPSKILLAFYINNQEINAMIQKVMYECLLPVRYPSIKKATPANSQRMEENQTKASQEQTVDPDKIRVERILTLIDSLEPKAKTVFFALQQRQTSTAKFLESYLQACEEWRGGDPEGNKKDIEKRLERLIDILSKLSHDPLLASGHLKSFAEAHHRRCYQLIRFCCDPASEYKKVANAQRELVNKMTDSHGHMGSILDTVLPLTRNASVLVYNKNHVPPIVAISRTDEKGLGHAAHEILKEISVKAPDIFKAHAHELCQTLTRAPPTATRANDPGAVDMLKACAGFARRYPLDMPRSDRKFYQAMVAFAHYGTPPQAAKHAITVIVTSAEKKEMYIRDIVKKCIDDFEFGSEGFLSKLASLSQLQLLANAHIREESDVITEIAITKILTQSRIEAKQGDSQWSNDVDDDLTAKLWALRILVNQLRGTELKEKDAESIATVRAAAIPVYRLLNTLIAGEGELGKNRLTPAYHKSRLRLAAAVQLLKLSCRPIFEKTFGPHDFNRLAKIAQDPLPEVRSDFNKALKKHLGRGSITSRFYALVFVYAFEPSKDLKEATVTWIRARAALATRSKDHVMESVFPRFISLLAHHQDFSMAPEELPEFVNYIVFYLHNVATEENIPIIYYLAQKLKTVADAIDPAKSVHLYVLSDLSDDIIRCYVELKNWSLQLFSGDLRMPGDIFRPLQSEDNAQRVSEKRFLPQEVAEQVEELVRNCLKTKKRKGDSKSDAAKKRTKIESKHDVKPMKAAANRKSKPIRSRKPVENEDTATEDRRRSARGVVSKNYAENDDSEDDAELEEWNGDDEKENMDVDASDGNDGEPTSTPPTSDPPREPARRAAAKQEVKGSSSRPRQAPQVTRPNGGGGRETRNGRKVATKVAVEKDVFDFDRESD